MKLLLVEDHDLFAHSLQLALTARGHEVARLAPASGLQLLHAVHQQKPDLVLLDLDLGEAVDDGDAHIDALIDAGAAVLLVTGTDDAERVVAALAAGAKGYVPKTAGLPALMEAVRRVSAGQPATRAEVMADLHERVRAREAEAERRLAPFHGLSASEADVLGGLMEGHSVDVLASRRSVAVATVRSQVRSVLSKLEVHSQLEAVALANKAGWSPPAGR